MKHFINIKDIPNKDLKKIILDAKRRKINHVYLLEDVSNINNNYLIECKSM